MSQSGLTTAEIEANNLTRRADGLYYAPGDTDPTIDETVTGIYYGETFTPADS